MLTKRLFVILAVLLVAAATVSAQENEQSVNYIQTAAGVQPTAGLTLALKF